MGSGEVEARRSRGSTKKVEEVHISPAIAPQRVRTANQVLSRHRKLLMLWHVVKSTWGRENDVIGRKAAEV